MRLVLGMTLKLQLCGKKTETKSQKCWGKLAGDLFALPPPPILNIVESELKDLRPVKTIKKEKYRFYCFVTCSVVVTCFITAIILENMFANITSAVFTYWRIGETEEICAVELACFQMLNISLLKIFIYLFIFLFILFKVGTTLVLTNKNQPTNYKYLHTYI